MSENQPKKPMSPKSVLLFVVTGLIGIALLTVGYFSSTLPFYYRTIIGFFGMLMFAVFVFISLRKWLSASPVGNINLRIRYCILLILFGTFLSGAVAGIVVYDSSYWGIGNTLYKLSTSFSINSSGNAFVYMIIFIVGILLGTFGLVVLGRKYSKT
jgi:hypothetical protein